MWELKSKNAFIRFPRNGSGWGKTFVWTECKIWAGKCPIYSHVDKREKCVSVCHKMGNNIHVQTISSNKEDPPVQEIFYPSRWHHLLPPVFYWWQMLWGLQCSTYIPMKIYKSQSNQAEWNKSSFLNVFISQFKGSTVFPVFWRIMGSEPGRIYEFANYILEQTI